MVKSLDSTVEFVLFMNRARQTDRFQTSSWSSTSNHPATGEHAPLCFFSSINMCLSTPCHLIYLWHFPCNLFSYTNDHQIVFPHRVSSVSCLQDEASRVGVSFSLQIHRTLLSCRTRSTGLTSAVKGFPSSSNAFHLTFDWRILFLYFMHIFLLPPF